MRLSRAAPLAALLSLAALIAGGACRLTPPAGEPSRERELGALGQIDPCALVSQEEVSALFGVPVRARLLVPTPDAPWPECRYEAGVNRLEDGLFLIFEPETVPERRPGDPEIGQVAQWDVSGQYATLYVWRDSQLGFTLATTSAPGDTGQLRERAIDLATRVMERLESPPAALAKLPPNQPAPFDVCNLLPLVDQVEMVGWAPTTPPGAAVEFIGGIGAGTWECHRLGGGERELNIAVSKAPVPEAELAALGRPLRGTSSAAYFVDTPRAYGFDEGAALLTTAPDGRMVELRLHDATDTRTRQAALIRVAQVVLSNLQ